MSVFTNFIHATEMRTASRVSVKLMVAIPSVFIPLVLLLMIALAALTYADRRRTLEALETQWQQAQRGQQAVNQILQQLNTVRAWHSDVSGWGRARGEWGLFLSRLQQEVPAEMQLRVLEMRSTPTFSPEQQMLHHYTVRLTGRCIGPDAEPRVESFSAAMTNTPVLGRLVQSAEVTSFVEDTSEGATPDDRVFQIELVMKPRSYDEAADD